MSIFLNFLDSSRILWNQFFYSYGLEIISLRYFNVLGPNQRTDSHYSAVIPQFIDMILKGKNPVIYGNGKTSGDFTYVENVVNANLLAYCCSWSGLPEVLNNQTSLNHLVNLLNELIGSSAKPIKEREM